MDSFLEVNMSFSGDGCGVRDGLLFVEVTYVASSGWSKSTAGK